MSKVVSGVGNAVSGVLKGAVNLVKDVGNGIGRVVKDIGSSQIGKAILIAGAVYFGGAAIAGGYGSAMGGGSVFTGMGAGVSSAASSLSSAWTSALAGNFAEAGSTLGSSWSTAAQSGAMTSPGYAAALSEPTVSLAETPANVAPDNYNGKYFNENTITQTEDQLIKNNPAYDPNLPTQMQKNLLPDQIAKAPNNGQFLSNLEPQAVTPNTQLDYSMAPTSNASSGTGIKFGSTATNDWYQPGTGAGSSVWDKVISSPYTAPALISGGMQVGGAYIQGQAQEKQLREQREYEARLAQEARDRYNANVGAPLWSSQQGPIYQNQGPAWDPYAEARARAAQVYAPAQTGLAAKYMTT